MTSCTFTAIISSKTYSASNWKSGYGMWFFFLYEVKSIMIMKKILRSREHVSEGKNRKNWKRKKTEMVLWNYLIYFRSESCCKSSHKFLSNNSTSCLVKNKKTEAKKKQKTKINLTSIGFPITSLSAWSSDISYNLDEWNMC